MKGRQPSELQVLKGGEGSLLVDGRGKNSAHIGERRMSWLVSVDWESRVAKKRVSRSGERSNTFVQRNGEKARKEEKNERGD